MFEKNKIITSVLATVTTACILTVFAFYQNMQVFKARTESEISSIKSEVQKKADNSMQIELQRQIIEMNSKLDKIIEKL